MKFYHKNNKPRTDGGVRGAQGCSRGWGLGQGKGAEFPSGVLRTSLNKTGIGCCNTGALNATGPFP